MIAAGPATDAARTSGKHNHWMQNRPGWCFLILTRSGQDWEKTLGSKKVTVKPESTGTDGIGWRVIVKFSKGLKHEEFKESFNFVLMAKVPYSSQ
jgi:hypothetical protein